MLMKKWGGGDGLLSGLSHAAGGPAFAFVRYPLVRGGQICAVKFACHDLVL